VPVKHNLVDDEEVLAEIIAETLANVGYEGTAMTRPLEVLRHVINMSLTFKSGFPICPGVHFSMV
jgi:DNA-binding response OmpR family regulator